MQEGPHQSFPVTTGSPGFPVLDSPEGTTTADNSSFRFKNVRRVLGFFVEDGGSAAGIITISDHAGTSGTAIVCNIPIETAQLSPSPFCGFGPRGIAVKWIGIQGAATVGTAQRVRVVFEGE